MRYWTATSRLGLDTAFSKDADLGGAIGAAEMTWVVAVDEGVTTAEDRYHLGLEFAE